MTLTFDHITEAHDRIRASIRRTPVFTHRLSSQCELILKPECLQLTGSFKLRGALNKIMSLPDNCPGIVAHSSGNHAQAVAYAAKLKDLPAFIVMPNNAPAIKRRKTEAFGATVIEVGPDSAERLAKAQELATQHGYESVEPYNDLTVAAGQGTAALELLEDGGPLDAFYAPISGGGLMAGCATTVSSLSPDTQIIGVEPSTLPRVARSLERGDRVTLPAAETLADGLRVRQLGSLTWPIIQNLVHDVRAVDDEELLGAMAFAATELKLVLEPSGAASLAAALREGRGRCGVLLSGGNVDMKVFKQVVTRGYTIT